MIPAFSNPSELMQHHLISALMMAFRHGNGYSPDFYDEVQKLVKNYDQARTDLIDQLFKLSHDVIATTVYPIRVVVPKIKESGEGADEPKHTRL